MYVYIYIYVCMYMYICIYMYIEAFCLILPHFGSFCLGGLVLCLSRKHLKWPKAWLVTQASGHLDWSKLLEGHLSFALRDAIKDLTLPSFWFSLAYEVILQSPTPVMPIWLGIWDLEKADLVQSSRYQTHGSATDTWVVLVKPLGRSTPSNTYALHGFFSCFSMSKGPCKTFGTTSALTQRQLESSCETGESLQFVDFVVRSFEFDPQPWNFQTRATW